MITFDRLQDRSQLSDRFVDACTFWEKTNNERVSFEILIFTSAK